MDILQQIILVRFVLTDIAMFYLIIEIFLFLFIYFSFEIKTAVQFKSTLTVVASSSAKHKRSNQFIKIYHHFNFLFYLGWQPKATNYKHIKCCLWQHFSVFSEWNVWIFFSLFRFSNQFLYLITWILYSHIWMKIKVGWLKKYVNEI